LPPRDSAIARGAGLVEGWGVAARATDEAAGSLASCVTIGAVELEATRGA
jgi:hypothetical protein